MKSIVCMFVASLPRVSHDEYLLVFFYERNEVHQVRLNFNFIFEVLRKDVPRPVYGSMRNTNKVVSNEFKQSFENIICKPHQYNIWTTSYDPYDMNHIIWFIMNQTLTNHDISVPKLNGFEWIVNSVSSWERLKIEIFCKIYEKTFVVH